MREEQRSSEVRPPLRTPKGWRWDVTQYRLTDPVYPGVFDGRQHLTTDFGYTRTLWGAWRKIRQAVR